MRKKSKKKLKIDEGLDKLNYINKIISAIFNESPLYIKDTGVKVELHSVNHVQEMIKQGNILNHSYGVRVDFIDKPTVQALEKLLNYDIYHTKHNGLRHNGADKAIVGTNYTLAGNIDILNLSLYPFETPGAKILHQE